MNPQLEQAYLAASFLHLGHLTMSVLRQLGHLKVTEPGELVTSFLHDTHRLTVSAIMERTCSLLKKLAVLRIA